MMWCEAVVLLTDGCYFRVRICPPDACAPQSGPCALLPLGLLCTVLLVDILGCVCWWNTCGHLCWECVHVQVALCSVRHTVPRFPKWLQQPSLQPAVCADFQFPCRPCRYLILSVFCFSLSCSCVVLSSCFASLFAFLWWLVMLFVHLLAIWVFSFIYFPNLWLIFLFGCKCFLLCVSNTRLLSGMFCKCLLPLFGLSFNTFISSFR